MYYAEPRTPTESDLQLIGGAGHIAAIAIEGERARPALEEAVEEIKKSRLKFEQSSMQHLSSSSLLGPTGNFCTRIRQSWSTPALRKKK
jgi:hypothetical protein